MSTEIAWSLNRSIKTVKNVKNFYTMTSEIYRETIPTQICGLGKKKRCGNLLLLNGNIKKKYPDL